MSDRKPQLKELSLALRDLPWSDIESMALQLDMQYIKLQQIKQQSNELTERLHSAMYSWLENDPKASWARIVTALIDINKNVLAKEIEQKYCQPLDIPHAITEESAANHPPLYSNTPPPPSPPLAKDPFLPISLAASDYSLPSPSPHIHTSDSTEVSSSLLPYTLSFPGQQAPPISPVSEYSHPTSPPSVSVATPDGGTPISVSEQSPSQSPSSPTQQPHKRKRRNSPTLPISPSLSPSPQPPPQPPQVTTEVSSSLLPHPLSFPSQQAPPITPFSEYSHPTSPPPMFVATPDGGTSICVSKQSPSQSLSSPTQQPRKRKRRNSPTLPISPSPSPSPQPPPQPPQLSTTQPQELPGCQPTAVRETKQEKIKRIREEASELDTQFAAVVGQAEFCFSVRESKCKTFLPKFRITLTNLPISKKFEHLKFLCEELGSASSVSEIFKLLRQYWKYTDFALLHHLINKFGDEETKEMMKIYTSSLETFEKQTTIKDFEDATGERKEVPQGFIEAEIELQKVKYTLYEVRQIVQSLAQQSTLEPYVLMIKKARIGSLVITIALPPTALELLQQALYKEFLDTLNNVSVTIIYRLYKTTQVKIFCHKCLKVHVICLNCDTVGCITFVTIYTQTFTSL